MCGSIRLCKRFLGHGHGVISSWPVWIGVSFLWTLWLAIEDLERKILVKSFQSKVFF